jgi:hypothetical protein
LAVIGEEGEADLAKIKSDTLVSDQDEAVLTKYSNNLPAEIIGSDGFK